MDLRTPRTPSDNDDRRPNDGWFRIVIRSWPHRAKRSAYRSDRTARHIVNPMEISQAKAKRRWFDIFRKTDAPQILEAFVDVSLSLTNTKYWPKLKSLIDAAVSAESGQIGFERLPLRHSVFIIDGRSFEAADVRVWFGGEGFELRALNFAADARTHG